MEVTANAVKSAAENISSIKVKPFSLRRMLIKDESGLFGVNITGIGSTICARTEKPAGLDCVEPAEDGFGRFPGGGSKCSLISQGIRGILASRECFIGRR